MSTPSASAVVTVNCEKITPEQLSQLLTSSTDPVSRKVAFNPPSDADSVHQNEFLPGYWLYTGSSIANSSDFGAYDKEMSDDNTSSSNVQVRQFLNPFSVIAPGAGVVGDALKHHVRKEILENISVVGLCDSQDTSNSSGIVAMVGGGLFELNNNGPDYFKYGDIVFYDVPDMEVVGQNVTTEPCSRLISRSLGAFIPYSAKKFVGIIFPDPAHRTIEHVNTLFRTNSLSNDYFNFIETNEYLTKANPSTDPDVVRLNPRVDRTNAEKRTLVDTFFRNQQLEPNLIAIRNYLADTPHLVKYRNVGGFDGSEIFVHHFIIGRDNDHCCFTFYHLLLAAVTALNDDDFNTYHHQAVNMQSDILQQFLLRKKGICMKPGGPGEKISIMLT